ncbi:hypothetical protein DYY66_1284 [Candidatus Nitrosotalea sp. FS]|nr:hypothetical protein [Candidatus Nitrosotalea sp. FS]
MYKYKIFVSIQIFTIHTSVMLFLRVSFRMFPQVVGKPSTRYKNQ